MSSGFMAFRCSSGADRNESDLCFHGGHCVLSTASESSVQLEACSCPAGYLHDYTLGHYDSCGLPRFALGSMFGVITCLTILGLFFSVPIIPEIKGSARRALLLFISLSILNWALFLSVWAQSGHFQPASVILFLSSIVATRGMMEATVTYYGPVFEVLHGNIRTLMKRLAFIEASSDVAQLVCVVLMIVHARDVDPNNFNSVVVVFQFFFTGTSWLFAAILGVESSYLRSNIHRVIRASESDATKFKGLPVRLRNMVWGNLICFVFFSLVFAVPIASIVLGSFPSQYLVFFFVHTAIPFVLLSGAAIYYSVGADRKNAKEKERRRMRMTRSVKGSSRSPDDLEDRPKSASSLPSMTKSTKSMKRIESVTSAKSAKSTKEKKSLTNDAEEAKETDALAPVSTAI